MNSFNFEKVSNEDLYYFFLINQGRTSKNLALKKIKRLFHGALDAYMLPVYPVSTYEVIDSEKILDRPFITILDGAYGLSLFFTKYHDGEIFPCKILIDKKLSCLVPDSWRKKVYFYDFFNSVGKTTTNQVYSYFHDIDLYLNENIIQSLSLDKQTNLLRYLGSNEDLLGQACSLKKKENIINNKSISDYKLSNLPQNLINSNSKYLLSNSSQFLELMNKKNYIVNESNFTEQFELVKACKVSMNIMFKVYKLKEYPSPVDLTSISSILHKNIDQVVQGEPDFSLNPEIISFLSNYDFL